MKKIKRLLSGITAAALAISFFSGLPQGAFPQHVKDTAGFTVSAENSADSSYSELYRAKLLEIIEDDNYNEEYAFDLYDLDSDNVPELCVSNPLDRQSVTIYTIYNNTVTDIVGNEYPVGYYGEVPVSQNNYLGGLYYNHGIEINVYYRKNWDKLECMLTAYNNSGAAEVAEEITYKINDVEVSKEEYDKALSEYNSFEWETVGRKYMLDESTVNSVFGKAESSETRGKCGDDAYWELSEDGVLTISGSGDVTENPWLENSRLIKKVIIRDNITSLCPNAFAYCEALKTVEFNSDLKIINNYAFMGCTSLEEMSCSVWEYQLPKSVEYIGQCAFMGCEKIKEIDLPPELTTMSNAFLYCSSLEAIYIPSSVTVFNKYDDNAVTLFDGCNNLTIYCEKDSAAEEYATTNNIKYQNILVPDINNYYRCPDYSGVGFVKYLGKSFYGSSGEGSQDYDYYSIVLDEPFYLHSTYYSTENSNKINSFIIKVNELKITGVTTDVDYSALINKRINFTASIFETAEGCGLYFISGDVGISEMKDYMLMNTSAGSSNVNASLTCDEIVYNMGSYSRNSYNALFTVGKRTSGSIAPSDGGKNNLFSNNEITYDLTDVEVTYKISGGFSFSADGKTNTIVSSTIPGKIRSNTVYTEELTIFPIGGPSDTLLITALITGNGGYSNSVTLNETVHKQFTAKYRGQETKTDKSLSFDYSDRLFDKPASEFDQKLVQASLALELSSWTSYGTDNWTSNGNFDRDRNLVELLHSLGFVDYESQKYDVALSNSDDSAAFGIARKEITGADGKTTNLIAVAVRGGGYGAEWASNFNVGDNGKYAEGFYNASTGVYNYIKDYIGRYGLGKDTKIWITGFSRAAATANLTAARLGNDFSNENIYAYTFATPQGYVFEWADSVNLLNKDYHNIHNIINPADLVPTVAFSGWGFIRFGESHIINYSDNAAMKEIYTQQMNGKEYAFNVSYPDTVREIDDLVVNVLASNTKEYKKLYQDAIFRIMQESNSQRDMFENGWQDAIVAILSDNRIKLSLEASKIKIDIPDLTDIKTPNDIIKDTCPIYITYKYFYDTVSEKIIKEISNKYDIMGILNQHYPEVYIGWVFSSDSTSLYSDMSYKTAIIDCPVDVYVYNSSGDLVASIINDEIVEEKVNAAVFGDQKRIYLHDDTYSIQLVGNDKGTMDYSIEEYDSTGYITRRTAVYDVPLEKGTTYSGQINEEIDTPAENYSLTNGNENYGPVFDSNNSSAKRYSVSVDGGVSTKPFAYPGEKVTVTALASGENSEFVKWSGNVELENADASVFTFKMPEANVELIAHTQEISDNQTVMSEHINNNSYYIVYISIVIFLIVIIFLFIVIKHKRK